MRHAGSPLLTHTHTHTHTHTRTPTATSDVTPRHVDHCGLSTRTQQASSVCPRGESHARHVCSSSPPPSCSGHCHPPTPKATTHIPYIGKFLHYKRFAMGLPRQYNVEKMWRIIEETGAFLAATFIMKSQICEAATGAVTP